MTNYVIATLDYEGTHQVMYLSTFPKGKFFHFLESNAVIFPSADAAQEYAEEHLSTEDYVVIPFNACYSNLKVHELIKERKIASYDSLAELLGD